MDKKDNGRGKEILWLYHAIRDAMVVLRYTLWDEVWYGKYKYSRGNTELKITIYC